MTIERDVAYTAMQPKRNDILKSLSERKKYAAELESELSIPRKVIAFHLDVLERHSLINGAYELKEIEGRTFAVRYYGLTEQGRFTLQQLTELLAE